MPRDRVAEAVKKLESEGLDVGKVLTRLANGESKAAVAASNGIHARWLSDLNPLIEAKVAEITGKQVEEGEADSEDDRTNMRVARKLAGAAMSLQQRIRAYAQIAKDKELPAGQRLDALKRLDDLTGIVPSKTPSEPDPPPMFALPENSELELTTYSLWLQRRGGDRGPQGYDETKL